jgi:hypothetical protein
MTTRDPSTRPQKRLVLSLATGALLVPLSAFGASSLLSASTEEPQPAPVISTTTTVGQVPRADLGVACAEEGMQLVAAEAGGSITEVQRAALDALRDICAAAGMPMPGPAMEAVPTPTTLSPTVPAGAVATLDDDDHDDQEDDDDERADDDDDRADDD